MLQFRLLRPELFVFRRKLLVLFDKSLLEASDFEVLVLKINGVGAGGSGMERAASVHRWLLLDSLPFSGLGNGIGASTRGSLMLSGILVFS